MDPLSGLLLLSSGLFLGWNLGANDAANIMGSAVGSRMLSFRRAAVIGAVFVVLGAAAGGFGGSETLGRLGTVGSLGGSFAVALSAAVTLFLFTRAGLPVSTSQAIVGALIGWNFFSNASTDWSVLSSIALSWVSSPLLAAVFSWLLFHLMRAVMRRLAIHLFHWDVILRTLLALAGAYGAFSLGMNNIANVMGVFVPVAPFPEVELMGILLTPARVLFIIGGISIAVGILTYSQRVMETIGSDIVHLSPENALVTVISVSTVLLLFSSRFMPQVPVSSSQAAVGAVIGIGIARGAGGIRYRRLGSIALGWLLTPVGSALCSYVVLNVLANVFLFAI